LIQSLVHFCENLCSSLGDQKSEIAQSGAAAGALATPAVIP